MGRRRVEVTRKPVRFTADSKRVIARPFIPGDARRLEKIFRRVQAFGERRVERLLKDVMERFGGRHRMLEEILRRHYLKVLPMLPAAEGISETRALLLGAYFTMEYAVESAALFNPSIVPDPDQRGLPPGHLRVILTFRAVGEGHTSSLEFRHGILDENNDFFLDCGTGFFVGTPELTKQMYYERDVFRAQLMEMSLPEDGDNGNPARMPEVERVWRRIAARLPGRFTYEQLDTAMTQVRLSGEFDDALLDMVLDRIGWLAKSNYEVRFPEGLSICERVLFPVSQHEVRGIEDARFVCFRGPRGEATYYATYTAYDGQRIQTQFLETKDFVHFRVTPLTGRYRNTKGMALFPCAVHGRYAMVSRVDGENLFIMFSDDVRFWHEATLLCRPRRPWECVQIGNCGSPIETDEGWLLLTHGVGPMRRYSIGAMLLDLEDPTRVRAQLPEPLIEPSEEEREGYVPNVVYSCGSLLHRGEVVIPYAMADRASTIATVRLEELLRALLR